MTEGDNELVRRTVAGDLAAFELLIQRYERSVRSVARAFIADVHVCEDATQEIFVAAFRSIATLREHDRFGPWLMQIARRVAGNVRQQQARTPVPCEFDEPESRLSPATDSRSQVLLSLIERLPEQERLVVTMRYFDGHRTQEIADATGIPLGTVTKQLSRAYERLRQWLATSTEKTHE
jgi:RNA polymerase sigma-70 factor (ECF subfamily)